MQNSTANQRSPRTKGHKGPQRATTKGHHKEPPQRGTTKGHHKGPPQRATTKGHKGCWVLTVLGANGAGLKTRLESSIKGFNGIPCMQLQLYACEQRASWQVGQMYAVAAVCTRAVGFVADWPDGDIRRSALPSSCLRLAKARRWHWPKTRKGSHL